MGDAPNFFTNCIEDGQRWQRLLTHASSRGVSRISVWEQVERRIHVYKTEINCGHVQHLV